MSDPMVLKSQQWLNATYNGRTGYVAITENGNTGWNTIYALRRALQIELGITATSSNFGPSTTNLFNTRFPNGVFQQDPNDDSEDNIYGIIQCACWCKGYSTGASYITKHFYSGTGNAIHSLKYHAGCADQTSTVSLNVMKALLSMDQFVLVSGGTTKIRTIQQQLNNEYENYIGLIPCNGLYDRAMNKAMIQVLQAIEGYSVSEATGTFGNGTKNNLFIVPSNGQVNAEKEAKAIKLIRYALCCNGYDVPVNLSTWDTALSDAVSEFQSDMCIQQTGTCTVDVWMALLLSKGNPDRSCVASDTRFEINSDIATYLLNNDYQIVGRYLTGGDFKELRYGEPSRILNYGLKLFPIFQETPSGATVSSYFSENRGSVDAKKAVKYARKHGIEMNTIIYFAVDMDPTDSEITTYILPYFNGVKNNIGREYRVGVYGTRNVCTRVMNSEYALTCFVSDMSTGYSGNMGFKMPSDWNLDQFNELSNITYGNTTFDLDKVAYSSKYPVVEYVHPTILYYIPFIEELEEKYVTYKNSLNETCSTYDIILGVTNFLRSFKYGSIPWTIASLTPIDTNFISYIQTNYINLYNKLKEFAESDEKYLVEQFLGYIDIGHLAATIEGYLSTTLFPDFWFGWGGDLATLMNQVDNEIAENGGTFVETAKKLFGDYSDFGYADVCTDADAIGIANILQNSSSNSPISDALTEYYSSDASVRISNYFEDLNNPNVSLSVVKTAILQKMTGVFENIVLLPYLGTFPSTQSKDACCEAMAQYLIDNYPII